MAPVEDLIHDYGGIAFFACTVVAPSSAVEPAAGYFGVATFAEFGAG